MTWNELKQLAANGNQQAFTLVKSMTPPPRPQRPKPIRVQEVGGFVVFQEIANRLGVAIGIRGSRAKGYWIDSSDFDIAVPRSIPPQRIKDLATELGVRIDFICLNSFEICEFTLQPQFTNFS